ncbi:hypothetical protein COU61_03550 [Candidatus Pacearchaeota archaeon CG10_big_fil_rev_8_21_14_0_10_35_13]|nr:MAG: hypothetical protein COU61_03550 [Candidatus Pacearchaeota archaeon CG10_big_fil_rev_8_21_14_0_10_35_13]
MVTKLEVTKAWIDDNTGNMRIAGTKTENTGTYCTSVPTGSFEIKDASGNCVLYIDKSGNLWLRGTLVQGASL